LELRGVLVGLLLVASGSTLATAADPVEGERAYASACARCHASVSRIARRIEGGTESERAAWLGAFLTEHHAPDAAMRSDLIAFLLGK
jgi:cytochrome c